MQPACQERIGSPWAPRASGVEDGMHSPPEPGVARALSRRRAVRHFRPDPLPAGLLEGLLDAARRTASGYNLQPWTMIVVRDPERRRRLRAACLGQAQVEEAPIVVVFACDTWPLRRWAEVAAMGEAEGHWSPAYVARLRALTALRFFAGPLRAFQPFKALARAALTLARPSPMFPVGRAGFEVWSVKQTALLAQSFLLLAAEAGLDTCPMEGIDERWVRRVVGLPRRFAVPLVVPVGYAVDPPPERPSPRLPYARVVHREQYGGD
jgi:nitroreductase